MRLISSVCVLLILIVKANSLAEEPAAISPQQVSSTQISGASTEPAADSPRDSLARPLISVDLGAVHLLSAGIESTSGHVSNTRVELGVGMLFPVTSQLSLGASLNGGESIYRFSGASGLVPEGVRPWGTVQSVGIGINGRYQIDSHWAVLGGVNGASDGEQGAKFGSTLTAGGLAGFTYTFSDQLTLGLVIFGESTLEANPKILPFPVISWALPFDPDHWRLEIGGRRTGPSENVGAGVVYSPSKLLSISAGVGGIGIGNDFRLDRHGPVADGVGRDSSVPLILSVSYHPNPLVNLSAFGGINTSDKLDLLNAGGGRINRVDEDASPIFGLNGAIQF